MTLTPMLAPLGGCGSDGSVAGLPRNGAAVMGRLIGCGTVEKKVSLTRSGRSRWSLEHGKLALVALSSQALYSIDQIARFARAKVPCSRIGGGRSRLLIHTLSFQRARGADHRLAIPSNASLVASERLARCVRCTARR